MLKPLLEINFEEIPIYYIMMMFGFYLAFNKLDMLLKREAYSSFMKKKIKSTFFIASIIGILGANVANWFLFDGLLERALVTRLIQGGFSFIFGLIAFLVFSTLLLKWRRVNTKKIMNLVVEPILIAHFWGRIGCSLRGCCWGETILIEGIEVMLPVREIEALCLWAMYWTISRKIKENQLWVYLLSYSIIRFVLEFFRGDDRGCLFGVDILSPTQIICILIEIFTCFVLFVKPKLDWEKVRNKIGIVPLSQLFKESLPNDYEEISQKNIKQRVIISTGFTFGVIIILFITFNPAQMNWCTNIQWKIDELFSVFTIDRSRQDEIGDGSGTEIIEITYEGVVDLDSATNVISSVDVWTGANYIPMGDCEITNGAKLYYYAQSVNGRPVLGTIRVLITDNNSKPEYMIADTANQTYTTDVLDTYLTNNATLKEIFGEKVSITSTMSCWYDTGDGLIAAEHVILSYEGMTPVMGAVLQESNNQIICFTGPNLGVLDNAEKMKILFDSQLALEYLNSRKSARGGSWVDNFNKRDDNIINEGVCEIVDTYDLTNAQVSSIIKSVNDIIQKTDSSNLARFANLFEHETRRVLSFERYDEKEIEKICKHIQRIFSNDDDEKSLIIEAQERVNKFKHKIHYYLDADVFDIISQENHSLEIIINTEYPIRAELYSKEGVAITSIYVVDAQSGKLLYEGTQWITDFNGSLLETGDYFTDNLENKTEGEFIVGSVGKGINKVYDFVYGIYDEMSGGLAEKIIGIEQMEEEIDKSFEESKVLENIVEEIDKRIRKLERELE